MRLTGALLRVRISLRGSRRSQCELQANGNTSARHTAHKGIIGKMSKFKIIITWIRVHATIPIYSFVANCLYWLFRLNQIPSAKARQEYYSTMPIKDLMARFVWSEDKTDWTKWPLTLIHDNLIGDCEDAARLAQWRWKQGRIKSRIYYLYNAKAGHAVCINERRNQMITNERIVNIHLESWKEDALGYFENVYEVIL